MFQQLIWLIFNLIDSFIIYLFHNDLFKFNLIIFLQI